MIDILLKEMSWYLMTKKEMVVGIATISIIIVATTIAYYTFHINHLSKVIVNIFNTSTIIIILTPLFIITPILVYNMRRYQ